MAKKKKAKKISLNIKDRKDGGFGEYGENTGGGTPVEPDHRGDQDSTAKGQKGRGSAERQGVSRGSSQPRTDDGKFTYNSVNGKPLKDISKKNGKSRGTTVPPVLTGGENGVRIDRSSGKVSHTKGGKWLENLEDWAKDHDWFDKGAHVVTFDGRTKLSSDSFDRIATEYVGDKKHGNFKGEIISDWKNQGGRPTKDVMKARADLKKSGAKSAFVKISGKPQNDAEKFTDIETRENGKKSFNMSDILKNVAKGSNFIPTGGSQVPQTILDEFKSFDSYDEWMENFVNPINAIAVADGKKHFNFTEEEYNEFAQKSDEEKNDAIEFIYNLYKDYISEDEDEA